MNKPIRAFVGHSFTSDDEAIVGRFTKFFDQLAKLYPHFSWTHAEPAEPKVLADKVMQLMEGANLFIGICTKKERVIGADSLTKTILPKGFLKGPENRFAWKTSDWIIQEIGLAKGKGMELMLLIEEGLRQPGGLQGNIEYIGFSREAPEKAFGKIVEMLTALSPSKEAATSTMSESLSATAKPELQEESPIGFDWVTPKSDWERSDYEFALMHLTVSDDDAGTERISASFLTSSLAKSNADRDWWAGFREHIKIVFNKGGDIERLENLADKHPESAEILGYLANGYEKYEQPIRAAETYLRASACCSNVQARMRFLRQAAIAYETGGEALRADTVLEKMKSSAAAQGEIEVLEAERALAEKRNQDDFALGAMERLVELVPSDNDRRFSLAYKYSETSNEALAMAHYIAIPSGSRTAVAWNNLGVAYDQVDLPIKSVAAYRKAEGLGETLAMSNLANKYLKGGFVEEARTTAQTALATKDFHKNVARSLTRIKEAPDEEDKKQDELLHKTRPVLDFYRRYGRALAQSAPGAIPATWKDRNCNLTISWSGNHFAASGSYERPALGLVARVILGDTTGESGKAPRVFVEYEGVSRGRAIAGKVKRESEADKQKVRTLLDQPEYPKILAILSEDGKEIRVMEHPKTGEPKFYSLVVQA